MNVSSYFLDFNLWKFPESWDKDEFLQRIIFFYHDVYIKFI